MPAAVFSPSGVPKGACGVCQKQVYDTQQRCRSDDGVVSAPLVLSAPSLSSLQDIRTSWPPPRFDFLTNTCALEIACAQACPRTHPR
jgi:hypothetical protein